MSQVLNILKDGKCKLRDHYRRGKKKLSHRKHLHKEPVKRQIAPKYILIIHFDLLQIAGQNKEQWEKITKHQLGHLAG